MQKFKKVEALTNPIHNKSLTQAKYRKIALNTFSIEDKLIGNLFKITKKLFKNYKWNYLVQVLKMNFSQLF